MRPGPRVLLEPDRAERVAVAAERERPLARLQAGDLWAVGVDEVVEAPHDVTARVVLDLGHLADDLLPLLGVDRPERLVVQRLELWVVPVRLVVRGDLD